MTAENAELVAVGDAWAEAIAANDAGRIAEFMDEDWAIVSASGISPGAALPTARA
jgi:ketosteroid isomerase-like protein